MPSTRPPSVVPAAKPPRQPYYPNGNLWTQTIAETANLAHTTTYTYAALSRLATITNANGDPPIQHFYDQHGNLTSTVDALQHTTIYTPNPDGAIRNIERPGNAVTRLEYDDSGTSKR